MYIGSLKKYVKSCEFFRRGTDIPLIPAGAATGEELLAGGTSVWPQLKVLNIGVDIKITLTEECFVDTILLDGSSGIGKVEVFTFDGAGLRPVANAPGGENPVAGVYCDAFLLRLNADYKNITVPGLDIIGAMFDDLNVYPMPASLVREEGEGFAIASADAILADTNDDDSAFAAAHFAQRLAEETGIELEVKPLGTMFRSAVIFKKDITMPTQNFRVKSMANICSVMAPDRLGLLYAAETIVEMARKGKIPAVTISDKPYMTFRGAHFGLPTRDNIPFLKRLIKSLLLPMRYNTIFIEIAGGMRYDTHPKINEAWVKAQLDSEKGLCPPPPHGQMVCGGSFLEKSEVEDIVRYAESFGFEVIPEIQSLSHVQYITIAYPEIGEVAPVEKKLEEGAEFEEADVLPTIVYPNSFCPSNERSYEILFDIAQEIIDVFKPRRFVHMGHDEVYDIGICEVCRDKDPAKLFAEDVNKIHAFLAKRGLKMMIWADMLHEVTRYLTPPAIDHIPKDIVMLDFIWYFNFDLDIEDRLLDHGFKVMMGNMYSSHYPRFASRSAKPGMIGAQVSTWVAINEYQLAIEGKLYDFAYSANMMWREGYLDGARRCYDKIVRGIMKDLRPKLSGDTPIAESAAVQPLTASEDKPFAVAGPAAVYSDCKSVTINTNGYYDYLAFTHAADRTAERIAWEDMLLIGEYEVCYEGDEKQVIPVEYGANICAVNVRYGEPLSPPYYRHEGYIGTYLADPLSSKDEDGNDVTLYRYTWKNPLPHKKVTSITLRGAGTTDAEVLLYAIDGIRR